ncbi:Bidirectional sugar transporter SWEET6b [Hibiscus syriacus]|uniref:Bidirectional sugar transporter SWEET n=1 Tax=Hibiscus syriacus TaxID=106335 RepID=A0A6A2YFQ0_HIBSY|nr:Bidirectional sugar transporter SWEET6b [Hibiscus syriacus]
MINTETIRTIEIWSHSSCFSPPSPHSLEYGKLNLVQDFKPDPYLATMMNCMMWVFYGLPMVHPDSLLIITINSIGLVIESIYIVFFFIYSDNKKRRKIMLCIMIEAIFMAAVIVITLIVFNNTKKRTMFVGTLAVIFNIGMYISPLTVMGMVIKTKSVKYMPFTLSLFNVLCGIVWMVYALLKFDINVLVPNVMGCLSGMMQLIIYAWFYKTTRWDEDEKAPAQKLQLSEI